MSKFFKLAVAAPVAMAACLAGSTPVSAAGETHYAGVFTAHVDSAGCQSGVSPTGADVVDVPLVNPSTAWSADGNWRVNVGTNTVSARFVIYLNGTLHVAYTTRMNLISQTSDGVTVGMDTTAGPLTVTISGGSMTYTITDYDSTAFMPDGAAYCPGAGYVQYHGTVK